jgi:hypothetical protein
MSQEPPGPPDPQETQPVAPPPEPYRPPPAPTERIPIAQRQGPPPGVWALLGLLVLAGVLMGSILGHFTAKPSGSARDPNLVLYEPAGSTTPFAGAQFTASTFNPQTGQCDKARLKQSLRANPRKFHAWLQLVGIDESRFDSFVDHLETARLTSLSPVTDHGCLDGGDCPFAFQAVLASGTPVWRDPQQGHIVAKCLSSTPLSAPRCPPNCSGGAPASSSAPATQQEQTLPPETPSAPAVTATPASTPVPVRTPEPVPTVTPF